MPAGKYDHHPELRPLHEPIRLVIDTEPVAKGRSRINIHGSKIHSYTPTKTKEAEDYLRAIFIQYKDKAFPPHIPVKLTVTFYRTRPRWTLKREWMPVRKGDIDNYVKTCQDAMNKLLVADDSQICVLVARKMWSQDNIGHIELTLEEVVA